MCLQNNHNFKMNVQIDSSQDIEQIQTKAVDAFNKMHGYEGRRPPWSLYLK